VRWLLPAVRVDAAHPATTAWLRRRFGAATLVLSPHFDDAAYSVAGVMRALAQAGTAVRMLTLFGRSAYAPNRPELDVDGVVALRLAEDAAAARLIHPQLATAWRDIPDVALRRGLAVEAVVSKAPLDAESQTLTDTLAREIESSLGKDETVVAPLGMGWHIDHRIAAGIGARLARGGRTVHFYEDLPYAGFTRSSRLWLAQAWRLRVVGLPLRAADIVVPDLAGLKQQVFGCYASQASDAFWRGISQQIRRRAGAERLWIGRLPVQG
jgi:LmbE family N-acetylglucosaminyl deacetylase